MRTRLLALILLVTCAAAYLPASAGAVAAKPKPKPNVLTWSKTAPLITNQNSATFAWKVKPVKTAAQCQLDKSKWGACKAAKQLTKLEDGPHTFRVRIRKTGTKGAFFTRVWSWRVDRIAPAGGSVSFATGDTNATVLAVSFTGGVDGVLGSGVASSRLERSLAPVAGAGCGAFAAFAPLEGVASSPAAVALVDGSCAQFRVTAVDRAGNAATFASVATVRSEQSDLVVTGPTASSTEGGASGSFTIRLTSPPSTQVIVAAAPAATDVTATPATRTFDASNWNVPQNIAMVAVDDAIDEAATVPVAVTFTASSADPNWNGETAFGVITVVDNDSAGVAVSPATNPLQVDEPSGASYIDLVLLSQPRANVTITLTAGAQVTTGAPLLTFTPNNWATPQRVAITVVDDFVDEASPHHDNVAMSVTSSDSAYQGQSIPPIPVDLADDDTAGTEATGLDPGVVALVEGAHFDVTVRLQSRPTAPVTVYATYDVLNRIATAPVIIQPADWAVPVTVSMRNPEDDLVLGNANVHVTLKVTSADPHYVGTVPGGGQDLTAVEDDQPALTVAPISVPDVRPARFPIIEGITSGTHPIDFTITLGTQPAGDVNVHLVGDDDVSAFVVGSGETQIQFVQGGPLTQSFRVWATGTDGAEADGELAQIDFVVNNHPLDEEGAPSGEDPAYADFVVPALLFSVDDADS